MNRTQRWLVIGSIALCLLIMFAGWTLGTGQDITNQASRLIAIGRLAGMITAAAVLLQFFVMSRAPFIEKNFSLEEINTFHRYNGYVMVYALIAHLTFLVVGYNVNSDVGLWSQFVQLNTQFEDVLLATIGSILFFAVAISSIKLIRKNVPYETWYFIHIVVYISILLTFLHQINSGADIVTQPWLRWFWIAMYVAVFICVAYWRFLRQAINYVRFDFRVAEVVQEAQNIYSVYISGRNIDRFLYQPGQYAHWRFLSDSLWLESHPFSFSSMPHTDQLRLTFKVSGDFTRRLVVVKHGTRVLIDGPRGSFTPNHANMPGVLLIAGGIGIAPFISLAPALLADNKSVRLLYSVTNRSDIAFSAELRAMQELAKGQLQVMPYISSERGQLDIVTLGKALNSSSSDTIYI